MLRGPAMTSPRASDELRGLLRLVRPHGQRPGERSVIEEQLRLIVDSSPDCLAVIDPEGRFLFANEAYRFLGYDPEQLIGRSSLDFIHTDDRSGVVKEAEQRSGTSEFRFQRANGEWIHAELRRRVIRDAEGTVKCSVIISRDITQQKQAEARFRVLSDNSPIGIYIAQDRKFVYVNPRFTDFTGYVQEELLGMEPLQLVFPEDREHVRASAVAALKAGHPFEYEYRIHNKAGETRWIMESVVSIEYQGKRAALGNYIDITERKKAEEGQRETLKELERSNQELAQFAYVASHDLQEPLRMVASFTQLLARRYKGQLDDDADEFIRYAVDGVTRMQNLINDLLAYSRVGTKGRPMEPTDANFTFDRACADLSAAIEQCGATVTRSELPTVRVDPTQFGQLVQNLLGNAIKYRAKDRPPIVSMAANRVADGWHFVIHDNGIGIGEEYRDRIFIIFQRLHGKEEYEGTGIGLAICKKIVERHGGQIWVESEPGNGSAFHFTIPDREDEAA